MFQEELLTLINGKTRFEGESSEQRLTGDSIASSAGVTILPGHEETWARILAWVKDITDIKREQEVRLELALQRERIHLLEDLVGNISHDIKTPLSTIVTNLYLLKKQQDPEKQQTYIQRLEAQVQRLNKLVEDVLTMSRLDKLSSLTIMPTNMNELVEVVAGTLNVNASLELQPDLQPVPGDQFLLRCVLNILIENAVNYTPADGSIVVRTHAFDGCVHVEVQDTGIGIRPEDLPHIFERFYRVDKSRNTAQGGTGLGLAIAKRILELHKGTISAKSIPGQGSTFCFRLPQYEKFVVSE